MKCYLVPVLAAFMAAACSAQADDDYMSYACGEWRSENALEAVYAIDSWSTLYDFYRSYENCDHWTIASLLSDRVGDLLATHWASYGALAYFVKESPSYLPFVLSHVDGGMTNEQAAAVLDNARNRCPKNATKFCAAVEKAVLNRHQEDGGP
jgi:hypothetical protein